MDCPQFVKIGLTFSSYFENLRGIPQRSTTSTILFSLFVNGVMFFINEAEVCNFANDTIIYLC